MSKVEKELLKKLKQNEQEDDEKRQDFLARIALAVEELNEKDWEAMSQPAKDWANEVADAYTEKKKLPDFPEDGGGKAPAKAKGNAKAPKAAEPEQEEEVEQEAKPTKGKRPTAAATPAEATGRKAPARAPAKERERGGMSPAGFVRNHLATHPGCTVDDIETALNKAGGFGPLSRMTISSLRNEFRAISRVLKELGYIKGNVDLGV